jgi:hypothetical protein
MDKFDANLQSRAEIVESPISGKHTKAKLPTVIARPYQYNKNCSITAVATAQYLGKFDILCFFCLPMPSEKI